MAYEQYTDAELYAMAGLPPQKAAIDPFADYSDDELRAIANGGKAPETDFRVQGKAPQRGLISESRLYPEAPRPANVTEAVATDTNPVEPFVKPEYQNPNLFPKKAWDTENFIKKDIPTVASTFGARTIAGMEQSAGGLLQSLGESPEDSIYGNDEVRTIAGVKVDPRAIAAKGKELGDEGRMVSQAVETDRPAITRAGKILGSTFESIGTNLPGMALSVVTGNAALGLTAMGLQTFGQAYDDARSKGLDIEDATNSAAIQGGTEVVTELAPLMQLAKFMKPGKLSTKVLNHYLADVPGEHVATAVQNATGKYYGAPNMSDDQRKAAAINYLTSREHTQDQIDTFFTTILQSAVMGGITKTATSGLNALSKPKADVIIPDTGITDPSVSVDQAIAAATATVSGTPVPITEPTITPAVQPIIADSESVPAPQGVAPVETAAPVDRIAAIRARLESMRAKPSAPVEMAEQPPIAPVDQAIQEANTEVSEAPTLPGQAPNAYTSDLPRAPKQNATPTYRGQVGPVPMPERTNNAQAMIDEARISPAALPVVEEGPSQSAPPPAVTGDVTADVPTPQPATVEAETPEWYINADDRPVLTTKSDAMGYRGPYSKQEVSELTGTPNKELNSAEQGKPVHTLDYPSPPPMVEKARQLGKARATIGGETGINGYEYKGGQFLPSTMAEPGKWKVGNRWVKSGKAEIDNNVWEHQPTPFSRSIYEVIRGQVVRGKGGELAVNTNMADNSPNAEIRPGVKGVLSKESYTLQELIDQYNKGSRWIDVKPGSATITTEPPTEPVTFPPADMPEGKAAPEELPDGISKIKVRIGDNVEERYAVKAPGRMGFKNGHGDEIYKTAEEAKTALEQQDIREADRANSEATRKAAQDSAKQAEDSRLAERNDIDGFAEDMSPMKRGMIVKSLSKLMRFNGEVMPVKERIRKAVAEGYKVKDSKWGRILEAPDGSFYEQKTIGKTGMDYAQHLIDQKSAEVASVPERKPLRMDGTPVKFQNHRAFARGLEEGAQAEGLKGRLTPKEYPRTGAIRAGLSKQGDVHAYVAGFEMAASPDFVAKYRDGKNLLHYATKEGKIKPVGWEYQYGDDGRGYVEQVDTVKTVDKQTDPEPTAAPVWDSAKERALIDETKSLEKKLQNLRDKYSKDKRSAMIPMSIRNEQMKNIEKLVDILGTKQEELAKMYEDAREAEAEFEAANTATVDLAAEGDGLPTREEIRQAFEPELTFSPEQAIKVAADDVYQLRPSDVYRVLSEAGQDHMEEVAEYIFSERKGEQAITDATLKARQELRSDNKPVSPAYDENREYTIAAQRPGMTKDDLKTVADVVQAFKDGKIIYGGFAGSSTRTSYADVPDKALADKTLDDLTAKDAKVTVGKEKVTITVKGEPLTAEQKSGNKAEAKKLTDNAKDMETQSENLRVMSDKGIQEKFPSAKGFDDGTQKRLDEAEGRRQYEINRLNRAISDNKNEASDLLTAKSKDIKHVFYFEGDRIQQGKDAGGDWLNPGNTDKVVKEARTSMKSLAGMDKAFRDNPVFKAMETDKGLMLVYQNGRHTLRLFPEAFNLTRPPGVESLAETVSQDNSIRPGDTVRLSSGYLENKTDEVYLIPKGGEGDVFYSGIDPAAIVESLSGLAGNLQQDIPKLIELGKQAFSEGAITYKDFAARMKEYLADKWEAFKSKMTDVYFKVKKLMRDERGSLIKPDDVAILNESMSKTYGGKWGNAYELAEMPDKGLAEAVRRTFGTNIVPVKTTSEEFNIHAGIAFRGTIYINVSADTFGFGTVVGHELLHNLKQRNKTLYYFFYDNAKPYIINEAQYRNELESNPFKSHRLTDGQITEEILADFTSDALMDPSFLTKLAKKNTTKFKMLIRSIVNWLGKMTDNMILEDLGSSRYFSDVETVRDDLANVLDAFAKGNDPSVIESSMSHPKFLFTPEKAKEPQKYDEYLDKAEAALDAGDFDAAVGFLDKAAALEKNPKTAEPKPPKDPDTRIRGLARNIEDRAIEAGLIEYEGDLGELPTYTVRSMADAATRVRELMDSDPDRVQRIIDGEDVAPEGLYPEDVFTGVRVRATQNGDVDTLIALLSSPIVSEGTTLGQRIKALDSGADSLDPFAAAKAISKTRQEQAEKTGSVSQAVEIARLQAELEEANAKLDAKYAELAVKKMTKETAKREAKNPRPSDRAERKQVLETERKSILRQLAAKFGRISANPMFDPETISLMISLARNSIEMGINTAAGVIDAVHADIKDYIKGVKKRHVRDALSNYGKTKELSADEIDVTLRELKRQWLLVSKIEDATKGKLPESTGMKHDPKSDELRQMEKELHQIMKKNGLDTLHSPEDHMKTALDAAKTRLRNEITDLDRQIAGRKRDPVQKTGVKYDKEAMKLQEIRNEKKKVLDLLDAKPGITEQRRVEIALNSLERSIEEYTRQIATGDFTRKATAEPIETPAIKKLRDERDALKKVRDEKRALRTEMEKQGVSDEDPLITQLNKFMADTERQIKAQEAALDKSIEEYRRRITENDLKPEKKRSGTPEIPGTDRKREVLASLKVEYEQMKKDALPPKDPEAIRLKTLKTRLTNEIAKLEKLLEGDDFTKQPARVPAELDEEGKRLKKERDRIKEVYQEAVEASGTVTKEEVQELVRLSKRAADLQEDLEAKEAAGEPADRFEYGNAKYDFISYADHLKGLDAPFKKQFSNFRKEIKTTWEQNKAKAVKEATFRTALASAETSVAMVASFDVSFGFMQGLKTLMTHPSAWKKGFLNQYSDFYNTLKGQNAERRYMADMYSRKRYRDGSYQKEGIVKVKEEQFPTTIPEKVYGIGRVFKASNAAFTGAGLTMRMDLSDLHADIMNSAGAPMDKQWHEDIGKVVNSMTGRGKWGKGRDVALIRIINWAPKLLKGNLDVLTAHGGTAGLDNTYAKKEAIRNIAKIVTVTGLTLMIAGAMIPGGVEWDPTSADFGMIKVGETRFDVTGGLRTIVILAARMIYNHQKDPASGLIIPYGSGFGQNNRLGILANFFLNKTPPPTSVVVSMLKGVNRDNEKVTFGDAMFRAFTPISAQNAVKAYEDPNAAAVVGALLSPHGLNSNTYTDTGIQRRDIVTRLRNGKTLTNKQQLVFDEMDKEKQRAIEKESKVSPLVAKLRKLPLEQLAETAKVAPLKIKSEIAPEFRNKYYRAKGLTPEEREKYKAIMDDLKDY